MPYCSLLHLCNSPPCSSNMVMVLIPASWDYNRKKENTEPLHHGISIMTQFAAGYCVEKLLNNYIKIYQHKYYYIKFSSR